MGGWGWGVKDEETDRRNQCRHEEEKMILLQDATYKVLSLGMWLKLATDSRLMLLLLRVLRRGNSK